MAEARKRVPVDFYRGSSGRESVREWLHELSDEAAGEATDRPDRSRRATRRRCPRWSARLKRVPIVTRDRAMIDLAEREPAYVRVVVC
jgi:anti-sigma factor RsiW